MQARKRVRRPRLSTCRVFHPDPDELLRALAVAFGLTTPPPEPAPTGKPCVITQEDSPAHERRAAA
jgi:hypothetical protein